jgi:hypothetical protein
LFKPPELLEAVVICTSAVVSGVCDYIGIPGRIFRKIIFEILDNSEVVLP